MACNGKGDVRSRTERIERSRRTADETLTRLDWCVDYRHGIRRNRIAQGIPNSVAHTRRQMARP